MLFLFDQTPQIFLPLPNHKINILLQLNHQHLILPHPIQPLHLLPPTPKFQPHLIYLQLQLLYPVRHLPTTLRHLQDVLLVLLVHLGVLAEDVLELAF